MPKPQYKPIGDIFPEDIIDQVLEEFESPLVVEYTDPDEIANRQSLADVVRLAAASLAALPNLAPERALATIKRVHPLLTTYMMTNRIGNFLEDSAGHALRCHLTRLVHVIPEPQRAKSWNFWTVNPWMGPEFSAEELGARVMPRIPAVKPALTEPTSPAIVESKLLPAASELFDTDAHMASAPGTSDTELVGVKTAPPAASPLSIEFMGSPAIPKVAALKKLAPNAPPVPTECSSVDQLNPTPAATKSRGAGMDAVVILTKRKRDPVEVSSEDKEGTPSVSRHLVKAARTSRVSATPTSPTVEKGTESPPKQLRKPRPRRATASTPAISNPLPISRKEDVSNWHVLPDIWRTMVATRKPTEKGQPLKKADVPEWGDVLPSPRFKCTNCAGHPSLDCTFKGFGHRCGPCEKSKRAFCSYHSTTATRLETKNNLVPFTTGSPISLLESFRRVNNLTNAALSSVETTRALIEMRDAELLSIFTRLDESIQEENFESLSAALFEDDAAAEAFDGYLQNVYGQPHPLSSWVVEPKPSTPAVSSIFTKGKSRVGI